MPAPRAETNHEGLQGYLDNLVDWLDANVGGKNGPDTITGQDFTETDNGPYGKTVDWMPPGEHFFWMWRLIPVGDALYVWTRGHVHMKPVGMPEYAVYEPKIDGDDGWTSIWAADGDTETPPAFSLPLNSSDSYKLWMVIDPADTEAEAQLHLLQADLDPAEEAGVEDAPNIHILLLIEFDTNAEGKPMFEPADFKLRSDIIICCEPDDSSSESGPSDSSGAGESKDTCIVEVPKWFHDTGYAALYCLESPNIEFIDTRWDWVKGQRFPKYQIDKRLLEVCERDFKVVISGDTGWAGAWVKHGVVHVCTSRFKWLRPGRVTYTLTATRKGFLGKRFGKRTATQFHGNNARLRQAYDGRSDASAGG